MSLRSILSIVVLGVAITAGCAKKADDAALVTNIKAQMFSDSQLKGANLQVTSSHGEVTLGGSVPSDAARLDAYKIATQTRGVTKVNDQMIVEGAPTAQADQTPSQPQPDTEIEPTASPAPAKAERHHKNAAKKHESETAPAPPDQVQPAQADQTAATTPPAVPDQALPAPAVVPTPIPAPPPPPQQVQIPAGTTMSIRMIDGVDSSVNKPGEIFHASLDAPVVVGNQVAVPSGADVYVRLANVSSAGRMSGQSGLRLELVKLEFQGQSYPLASSTYSLAGSSRGKDTAKKVGAGAVLGTLLGAIAGGGKGAAIGAAAGAGAGGVYQASTHGKQVKVPSETKLDFQLDQPVTVTVMPHSAPSGQ
jgi:BON domain